MTERVLLLGGRFDGEYRDIDPARRLLDLEWEEETVEQEWDGATVYVTRIGVESYRRVSTHTFVVCRTQSAMGDTDNLALWENQLEIETKETNK